MPSARRPAYSRFRRFKTNHEWTFVRNSRGSPSLYHFGHIYRCDNLNKNRNKAKKSLGWRCMVDQKMNCKARLSFVGNRLMKETPHNHEPILDLNDDHEIEYKSLEDDDIVEWLKSQID